MKGVNAIRTLQHGSKQDHLQQPNRGFPFSSLIQDPPHGGDYASYGLKCLQFVDIACKARSMSQGQVFKLNKGVHQEGICHYFIALLILLLFLLLLLLLLIIIGNFRIHLSLAFLISTPFLKCNSFSRVHRSRGLLSQPWQQQGPTQTCHHSGRTVQKTAPEKEISALWHQSALNPWLSSSAGAESPAVNVIWPKPKVRD